MNNPSLECHDFPATGRFFDFWRRVAQFYWAGWTRYVSSLQPQVYPQARLPRSRNTGMAAGHQRGRQG